MNSKLSNLPIRPTYQVYSNLSKKEERQAITYLWRDIFDKRGGGDYTGTKAVVQDNSNNSGNFSRKFMAHCHNLSYDLGFIIAKHLET